MNLFKQVLTGLFVLINSIVFAQINDTIKIQSVEIIASKSRYMIASKTQQLDSVQLSSVASKSLADIISKYMLISVKQNASGLATIRFRGTSPDHTAIMFNGININSLTLGHSNVSNIPAFLFTDVKVQYGSASAIYGSDAIGGSIHLANKTNWNKGLQISVSQDIASFNSYFSGVKIAYSKNKFSYSVKAYRNQQKNDFPFINISAKDFAKDEFIRDTSKNSAKFNYGLLQTINYKISNELFSHITVWYDNNWSEIQPTMSANYYGGSFAQILDKHLRAVAGLKYYKNQYKLTTNFAYVSDYQIYNKNENEIILTQSAIAKINYYNSNLLKGDFNIGVNYQYIQPTVHAYADNLNENRIDAFLSYKKTFLKRISISINARESYVTDYKYNFSPSIGVNYNAIKSNKQKLNIKASYADSYKTPSLNHRYWLPNANPDILTEKGNNYEFGTEYNLKTNNLKFKTSITGFYMIVDNWIQWVNLGVWQPVNKRKVESKGIEFNSSVKQKINSVSLALGLDYTYNVVTEVESYTNSNLTNTQMMYSPKHIGKLHSNLFYKKMLWQNNLSYNGSVFTEADNTLDAYLLLDSRISKNITYNTHTLSLSISANNILDKAYQSWEHYAMPGRNYSISIKYFFN